MKDGLFTSARSRQYHDSMLIVKVREAAMPAVAAKLAPAVRRAMAMSAVARAHSSPGEVALDSPDVFSTPGMNLLERLERGGRIKRVVPLARPAADVPQPGRLGGALLAVATAARAAGKRSQAVAANSGVSIVELERGEDTLQLQKALGEDPHVEFASRIPIRYLLAKRPAGRTRPARRAPAASTMWNLEAIRWAQARRKPGFRDATNVSVAVLDSGIDRNHPDLAGRVSRYTYLHPDTATISAEDDIIGHGTHVAGTIGALIGNRRGINGICRCRLNIWKIFSDQPEFSGVEDGFEYYVDAVMYQRALADCLDEGIDVVNLSIGGGGAPDPQELRLFEQLMAAGTTVVAAMGNERREGSPTSYPAAIPGVIAVGATSINDRVARFSNRGDHITLCAPGKGIWSTLPTYPGQYGFEAVRGADGRYVEGKAIARETDYDDWDGTSMASPHVAAAVALLIARRGRSGPAECRKALMERSDPVPGMAGKRFDSDYGYGLLNLERLLR